MLGRHCDGPEAGATCKRAGVAPAQSTRPPSKNIVRANTGSRSHCAKQVGCVAHTHAATTSRWTGVRRDGQVCLANRPTQVWAAQSHGCAASVIGPGVPTWCAAAARPNAPSASPSNGSTRPARHAPAPPPRFPATIAPSPEGCIGGMGRPRNRKEAVGVSVSRLEFLSIRLLPVPASAMSSSPSLALLGHRQGGCVSRLALTSSPRAHRRMWVAAQTLVHGSTTHATLE